MACLVCNYVFHQMSILGKRGLLSIGVELCNAGRKGLIGCTQQWAKGDVPGKAPIVYNDYS